MPMLPRPTRRSFLAHTGVAVASAALAPRFLRAAEPSAKKLRVGIVGGRFGASFQFHEHPDCIVQAVSDLRPERLAHLQKTYRCGTGYPSLAELLKDASVDAVFIATGAPDHVPHVLECLAAGKHALCAVPAAMSLEECARLRDAVQRSGLTYMMAETSAWQQLTLSARKFYEEGKFGRLYFTESEYHHAGLESLYFENGQRTWRHGLPPMHYPTHCTSHLVSVTGERLTEVSCIGWGDDDPILKDNAYKNPFWNETALFQTDKGNGLRIAVWWRGAHKGTERAQYYGDKMSFFFADPNGIGPVIVRSGQQKEKDDAGFERQLPAFEKFEKVEWWKTDLLPEPLRHNSGHDGSHTFITHEFVDACRKQRKPRVDVREALAYTAPGIVAHQSALKHGEQLKIPSFDA